MADKEDAQVLKGLLPAVGIGTAVVVAIGILGRALTGRRAYAQNGQYMVSVRYPGQWHDIREFIQPSDPEVLAVYSQIGPDAWALYDFVCENTEYVADFGEHWRFPSETLRGYGDCEDSANLLTSLLRAANFDAYTTLGSYYDFGHAWSELNGRILETTLTRAAYTNRSKDYIPLVAFNELNVFEAYPGALAHVFELTRDEPQKLALMAQALEAK